MTMLEFLLGALAGSAVGFTLGLVGGGGSILAVPLMVYLVGVQDPHVATGLLSGFFGIGGGFLVVPGLIASTGMPILFAVGSSLVAVTAFGLTTALSYASSGLVAWPLAAVFIGGGAVGSLFGTRLATRLADRKGALNTVLAALIVVVALYMLYRTATELGWL